MQASVHVIEDDAKVINESITTLVDINFDKDARTFYKKIMGLSSEIANVKDMLSMKYIDLQQKLKFLQELDEQVQNLRNKLTELEKISEAPISAVTAKDMEDNIMKLQV